jgi:hypothetical protein
LSHTDNADVFFPHQIDVLLQLFGDKGFEFLSRVVIIGFGLQVITLLMSG